MPMLLMETAIHFLILLVLPPLLNGIISRTKAVLAGRRGPPLFQLYYDLAKLLRKGMVLSGTTTWVFRAGPVVSFAAVLLAGCMIPLGGAAPLHFAGDFLLVAYLFALARFFLAIAALDVGSSFEGMGAAREVAFAVLAEPAFFAGAIILVRLSGALSLSSMLGAPGSASMESFTLTPILLLALSWSILVLSENSRIPFDDPGTHLELTMIHEVMILDHSGPALALLEYAASMKLFLMTSLVMQLLFLIVPDPVTLFPWMSVPGSSLQSLVGSVLLLVLVGIGGVMIGLMESTMARLRLTSVAAPLVSASLLSVFGFVLLLGGP